MLSTLQIETIWLREIFDMKNSNDSDLDYHPQRMWQIENIVHRPFLGFIGKEDFLLQSLYSLGLLAREDMIVA